MTNAVPLAADGGPPVRSQPFAPWPHFEDDEIQAAEAVLRSGRVNYWTGDEGTQFEAEFAELTGTPHAIALANGTLALEAALLAFGVGAGHDVIVPARTFIASASAVVARGATPIVADIDRDSQNVTAETVAAALTPDTKAVIVVHLGGWPCEMDPIMALAEERGLVVIEDCAQALGASYKDRPVGSIGHAGAFSFCQDKILTTAGEGGMLTLRDDDAFLSAWSYKDHGKSYQLARAAHTTPGVRFKWLHESFGSNWRMTEVQSAIGRVGLRKVHGWVDTRRQLAGLLDAGLAPVPGLRVTRPPSGIRHAYYKHYVFVEPEALAPGWTRDRIAEAIRAEGIPCFTGSCPEIYREQAFISRGFAPAERLPVARELGETSLMFLVHPTLTEADIADTLGATQKVMRAATVT
jgi:hypothetical protein